jgi:hypothetical protein
MLPLRDDIPARHFPIATIGLIAANIIVFLFELAQGPGLQSFIMEYGFVPVRFNSHLSLQLSDPGRYLPILSSMFLHGGLFHLISNMWFLWIFGDNVEDCMGSWRYVIFYLLCGAASVLVQAVANPTSQLPMVGASGAISGVLGAYFLTYPRARILTLVPLFILFYLIELPAYIFLGLWFLLQFLSGYSSLTVGTDATVGGIAWWAHVGGFGAGMLLLYLFRQEALCQPYNRSEKRVRRLGG